MKYFFVAILCLASVTAQAASLKLKKSITLSGETPSLLTFRIQATGELSPYCDVHAYVQNAQAGLQYTLLAGTTFPLALQSNHEFKTDWENGGIVYEVTSLTARIDRSGYLVAACRAAAGKAQLPDTGGLLALFKDLISIEN